MSGDVNVYSSLVDPLPLDELLAALRARGIEADWTKDDIWAAADERPWRSGRIASADGASLGIGVEQMEDEEKEDLAEEAASLGPDAERTAAGLHTVYRLHGSPGPLLDATLEVVASAAPSLILDPESGEVWHSGGSTVGPER
jgi:hypothetical protein